MRLASQLNGVELRFSYLSDARAVAGLLQLRDITEEGLPSSAFLESARVQSAEDVVDLIQRSFISITALTTVGRVHEETAISGSPTDRNRCVVGFLALNTAPHLFSNTRLTSSVDASAKGPGSPQRKSGKAPTFLFPPGRWEDILYSGIYASAELDTICPSNTLWTSFFAAPPPSAVARLHDGNAGSSVAMSHLLYTPKQLLREMLTVALSVSQHTANVLCPLPPVASSASMESLFKEAAEANPLPLCSSTVRPAGFDFKGTLLHIRRGNVIPPLALRRGRIEDYDDFVPLLVRGAGVVTELPEDFYLDEVLKHQDDSHKVGIAENPVTHEVVGLACAHVLSLEEQQYFTKQYSLEPFNKFRPTGTVNAQKGSTVGGTTVRLDFLYFDDAYNGSSEELVHYMFCELFPACEYLLVTLPHAQPETPFLHSFSYLPIRHYQPHNSRGEFAPVPPGLWVCSRQSTLNAGLFRAKVVRTAEQCARLEELLHQASSHDLNDDIAERIREDVDSSLEQNLCESRDVSKRLPSTSVFELCDAAGGVVGAVSARRMIGSDLYALKANYDLDQYLSLYTHTGKDYTVTDISQKKRPQVPPELSGVMLRAMYVKPPFRTWIRFFVREVLRMYEADIACMLTPLGEEPYAPLVRELITAKPRRVIEGAASTSDAEGDAAAATPDLQDGTAGADDADGTADDTSALVPPTGDVASLSALRFTTARFLGDEKRRVHVRVAVVGASATGIGFLHALLSTPFASFTNLVLISTDGFPPHPNQEPTLWQADHLELMEREYLALQQGNPVRVVAGAMIDLDKVNRFLSVDNGTFEPYDFLILATGRQYVLPPSVRQLLQQEGRTGKKSIIPLNGELALDKVRQSLAAIDANTSNVANVMVYGSGLDALAVASAMVEDGFSAQRVVVCAREEALPEYMDEVSYQAILTLFRTIGINVFRGYDVSRMEFDDENNLCSVLIAPVSPDCEAGQSVELACCLVVCTEDKDIDASVLSTLNKRSIVFDGRVIVNRRYRTTDPYVFAAGPVAMWTRRYGTATPNFEDYTAKDVGDHLSLVMLGHLGFDEFVKLAARPGRETLLPWSEREPLTEGDHDSADDSDEDDSNWNTAANKTSNGSATGQGGVQSFATGTYEANGTAALPGLAGTAGGDRGSINQQLRKNLPSYVTPIARRVRLPHGYSFFSVQCVDAQLNRDCDALRCDTVDADTFSALIDGQLVVDERSANQGSHSDDALGNGDMAGPTKQSVVSIYVNRNTRRIDGVCYFGLDEPPTGNFRAMVGLPETVLNLAFRYKEAQERVAECLASPSAAWENGEQVNLAAHSGLTAGVRCGQLDLIQYLRLPHLQTIFYDRFTDFFRVLERRSKAHDDAVKMREQILKEHKFDGSLTPEQISAYQAEITAKKSSFKYEVQLALIAFLHEHKNFRPNNMYLPDVSRAVAAKVSAKVNRGNGVTMDPSLSVR